MSEERNIAIGRTHAATKQVPQDGYTWAFIRHTAMAHKRELALAHVVAVLGAVVSVPIPLLMPVLVDEVLLDRPGPALAAIDALFPSAWQGPVLYIGVVLLVTLALRFTALGLSVWQVRQFAGVAKSIIFRIRRDLLLRLRRVSMAEFETLAAWAECLVCGKAALISSTTQLPAAVVRFG